MQVFGNNGEHAGSPWLGLLGFYFTPCLLTGSMIGIHDQTFSKIIHVHKFQNVIYIYKVEHCMASEGTSIILTSKLHFPHTL